MVALDSQTVGRLMDDLTRVEQSARRVRTPDDEMPVIIRDAWQTIGAFVDERARLLATIDALNIELAMLRPAIVDTTPVTVQATWDDDAGLWWFEPDPDPETDFARYSAMAAVEVPRFLWDRYLWLRNAWNETVLAVCGAVGLERNDACRVEPCSTPPASDAPHCPRCGYTLYLHEVDGGLDEPIPGGVL